MPPALQPLSQAYEQCVKDGKLQNDEAQRLVIAQLQALSRALTGQKHGLLQKILPFRAAAPRSLYIWGAVGRGKSLLMDMFFAATEVKAKRRIHFHAFMQEVHGFIHERRQHAPGKKLHPELMTLVARDVIKQCGHLICLDELQVTDVADAMILSRLFTALVKENVTFVITSNRPPEELYLGGLQREQFMEFVHFVYERMEVLELASHTDYRMQQIRAMQAVYLTPENAQTDAAFANIFSQLTHHASTGALIIEVQGRKLEVPECYGGIARFSFHDLCEKPLGNADYLAIARRFHTLLLRGIPLLTPENRNEARRFVLLIDTLYDHRVKLICTAAAPPEGLYTHGDGVFEFRRTVSRLAEMQSAQYLAAAHIP